MNVVPLRPRPTAWTTNGPRAGLRDIPIDSHHQHQEDQQQATNAYRVQNLDSTKTGADQSLRQTQDGSEFRKTLSRLAEDNPLVFTTHSPFLVGPDELDIVRVVEMTDRNVGTKVHTKVMADDPASLLPLQEALGYDLAQSLFAQQRNLVLEGLTDYWYIDATASLIRADGGIDLKENIALNAAGSAGKVVYYATILHAQKLKVAALLDSDAAGDQAARQDTLVHTLGNKGILRTKDSYAGTVAHPEIEDLLRDTLVLVGKEDLGWDVTEIAASQPARPIVDIFADTTSGFSKYISGSFEWSYLRAAPLHPRSVLPGLES